MDEVVAGRVRIPVEELRFRFARSGGPGGQHVNTSSTKVELRFDVDGSPTLDEAQKAMIHRRLGNRVTADGELVLTSSEYRSQTRNREAVVTRFAALLADALTPTRPRRPTRPGAAARQRRLDEKRHRSRIKSWRSPPR